MASSATAVRDNWERLVAAVVKKQQIWQLCHQNSISTVASDFSDGIFSDKEDAEEAKEDWRNRIALEAFVAKLFATISSTKAAYAELQMAQSPYNSRAIDCADQAIVHQLMALSDLKRTHLRKQIDSSPPPMTLMLAEIQEQRSLIRIYEITVKQMQAELESKKMKIKSLHQRLQQSINDHKSLEKKI